MDLRTPSDATPRGCFYGTGIVGGVEAFAHRYGPSATNEVVAKLLPTFGQYVRPNAPVMGLLGARRYPYPFVGSMFRAMIATVRADEDRFLREITGAGIDATLSTVGRIFLKYAASPWTTVGRAQEIWDTFHDAGRVTIERVSDHEYVAVLADWPSHDTTVCKICMEARRRVVERTGVHDLEVRRERCQAWGHEDCAMRVRWTH